MNFNDKLQADIIEEVRKGILTGNTGEMNKRIGLLVGDVDYTQEIEKIYTEIKSEYDKKMVGKVKVASGVESFKKVNKVQVNKTTKVYSQLERGAKKAYSKLNEDVQLLVGSGEISLEDAVRQTFEKFSGVTIKYKNGAQIPFNNYLNMLYRTEQRQICENRTLDVANDIGTKVFEYSSHSNPRTNCSMLEGKPFSIDGSVSTFTDGSGKKHNVLNASIAKWGSPDGAQGINCTHTFYPLLEGVSKLSKGNEEDFIAKAVNQDNDSLKRWTGPEYAKINSDLINKVPNKDVDNIKQAFKNNEPLKDDKVVYRGGSKEEFKNLEKAKELDRFKSTSTNLNTAGKSAALMSNDDIEVSKFVVKKGSKNSIELSNSVKNNDEVLLNEGAKIKYVGKDKDGIRVFEIK